MIDWGSLGGLHVFCAVLAWCRFRFVRFATDEHADTTFALPAECFEQLGGVPGRVLAGRMGCLKGGVVANMVILPPDYVRFVAHYGSGRTSARRTTRRRRGSWRTSSVMPSAT